MNHNRHSMTPTQEAANGALAIYVEGFLRDNVSQMLFGLSVLASATNAQVQAAMPFVHLTQHVAVAEIEAMLARQQ